MPSREPERKQATVLFADIKDSMEIIGRHLEDPEIAMRIVDPVLDLMIDAIENYAGEVIEVLGDGIMAVFGAGMGQEDHAMAACSAALTIQSRLRGYAPASPLQDAQPIQARVGLTSGETVVRAIRRPGLANYAGPTVSLAGPTTSLAARLEQLAHPGGILIGLETYRLVEGLVQVNPLGPTSIKGLHRPIEVFELLGIWPGRTRWYARALRGLTPLVGRTQELQTLMEALDNVQTSRHGQFIALVGEAGLGKSRIAWECAREARERGWVVLETAAVPHTRGALRPFGDMLRTYFDVDERAQVETIFSEVRRRLALLGSLHERHAAALMDTMRLPFRDDAWRNLEPAQRRAWTFDAIGQLVKAEAHRCPILVVVEDLHWIDEQSEEVLALLSQLRASASLMLLVTYRREYQPRADAGRPVIEIPIEPLPRQSAAHMLDRILGDEKQLHEAKRSIIEMTEGNPFFIEECVNELVASKAIEGERGHYRPKSEATRFQLPTTVQALLANRIDRLDPTAKKLLQTLAVAGRHVPTWLIRTISDLPQAMLEESLRTLQSASLLYEYAAFDELEVAFVHALTQEVAYRSLVSDRRRSVHLRILQEMLRHYGDKHEDYAEILAHHAHSGENWESAAAYSRISAAKAMARSEYSNALRYLEEARSVSARISDRNVRMALQIDIGFDRRNVLWALGRLMEGIDVLDEVEPLAEQFGDRRRLARLSAHRTSNYFVLGENDQALRCAAVASSVLGDIDDRPLQVDLSLFRGVLHNSLGDFTDALTHLDRIMPLLTGGKRHHSFANFYRVHAQTWRVWCLAELGRFGEAEAAVELARTIAGESNNAHQLVAANWAAGYLDRVRGRRNAAFAAFEKAHLLCVASGIQLWLRPSTALLGDAHIALGRLAQGLELLKRAVRPAENNIGESLWKVALAGAYLKAQQPQDAFKVAAETIEVATKRKEFGFAAHGLNVQSKAAAAIGRADTARALALDALVLASERHMKPLMARCHMDLSALGDRSIDRERAALDLCHEMGVDPGALAFERPGKNGPCPLGCLSGDPS